MSARYVSRTSMAGLMILVLIVSGGISLALHETYIKIYRVRSEENPYKSEVVQAFDSAKQHGLLPFTNDKGLLRPLVYQWTREGTDYLALAADDVSGATARLMGIVLPIAIMGISFLGIIIFDLFIKSSQRRAYKSGQQTVEITRRGIPQTVALRKPKSILRSLLGGLWMAVLLGVITLLVAGVVLYISART